MSSPRSNRRQFITTSALAGAGFWVSETPAAESNSPNEKIRFACIGVGGKGQEEARDSAKAGDVVAICDIDDDVLGKIGDAHPKAKRFQDWRDMFDEIADGIDAVTVSTPDHSHAVIAAAAMRLGKHVYVQKPLTHSLWEARQLAQIARETKVATQMGNQGTAGKVLRKSAAMLKAGVIGPVKEVYVWTNRPIWDQGIERPAAAPAPKALHWKLFIGPAAYRPFGAGYHPFKWRGWWDFGTGSLGDMACHTMNLPFMSLDLRNPATVQAETTGHNGDSYPSKSKITYEFPTTIRPPVKMVWSDGAVKPPRELLEAFKPDQVDNSGSKAGAKKGADAKGDAADQAAQPRQPRGRYSDSGAIFVGEKGMLYAPGDYAEKKIQLSGVDEIDADFIESPGHFAEWVREIKGGDMCTSNFPHYAVPLTETVLLGNLAIWLAKEANTPGKKIEWDAKNLTATNAPEVAHLIKPELHNGYSL
ncbi:MAG TPA: Gfo/Idh/MocA family oxidoreductase [Pirellulales bacterium]